MLPVMAASDQSESSSSPNGGTSIPLETEFFIIGAGPAGASLACFLSSHGMKGLMIAAAPGTSETPRAHITNPAAMECMRDINLEGECMHAATSGDCMMHTRFCHSMTGEEYARIYSWGNDPKRKGDYDAASPCRHTDLPQTLFEPIIVRRAIHTGWTVRFSTTFLSLHREPSGTILSTCRDNVTNHTFAVRSKYLFGADGGRSQVIRELGIPLIKKPGQGLAINVLVRVDLSPYIAQRQGNLHWTFTPEIRHPDWGWTAIIRMVKPWTEWMFIFLPAPGKGTDFHPTNEEYAARVREFIGKDDIPFSILNVAKWYINETVAESYSVRGDNNIFCLGDAVHRHPPLNGLGSNTCVQDAFNLAWKVAYVHKGFASPSLLSTYSTERQPVGLGVVIRANQGLRDHVPIWDSLGMLDESLEGRMKKFNELGAATPEGAKRREAFRAAIDHVAHEFHGIGVEMNQRYDSSAIYTKDEEKSRPPLPADPVLEHEITTYPGSRLPHAWLNTRVPGKQISTIDLAGHGAFCLLTGIGGERWKVAVTEVGRELGVEIRTYVIGWKRDYEDVYSDWAMRREVREEGCVLVRPDRFVAWRSMGMVGDGDGGCGKKLTEVLKNVLGR